MCARTPAAPDESVETGQEHEQQRHVQRLQADSDRDRARVVCVEGEHLLHRGPVRWGESTQPTTTLSIKTAAADAIAAAPTTQLGSARVGVGPVVAATAPTGTCRDSCPVGVFCGDLISYSF